MDHSPRGIRPADQSAQLSRPGVDGSTQSLPRRLRVGLLEDVKDPPPAGAARDSKAGRLQRELTDLRGTFESYLTTTAGSDEEMRVLSWLRDYVRTALQLAEVFPDIEPAVERARNEITAEYGRVIAATYLKGRGAAELMNVIPSAYDDFSDVESSLSPRVADLDLESKRTTRTPPSYRRVTGPLFGEGGAQLTDVTQGDLGDCWLLGPLSAAANTPVGQQKLTSMITPTASGFTVSFNVAPADTHGEWTVDPVPVISSFPMTKSGMFVFALAEKLPKPTVDRERDVAATTCALWPAVIEKAWATRRGGYDLLAGGEQPGAVFEAIYGVRSPAGEGNRLGLPLRGESLEAARRAIIEHLGRGDAASVATRSHYVAVTQADEDGFTFRDQSDYQKQGNDVVATQRWAWSDIQDRRLGDEYLEFYVPSQALDPQ